MHTSDFINNFVDILSRVDQASIITLVEELIDVRQRNGKLFVLGLGGSAANASHFVNDARKLCHIEAYAPTDNVAELSARVNDDGCFGFCQWLETSHAMINDALLILSVGGGSVDPPVSMDLISAAQFAKDKHLSVMAIVGRDTAEVLKYTHYSVVMPKPRDLGLLTPLCESFQPLILHMLVSHPALQMADTKW